MALPDSPPTLPEGYDVDLAVARIERESAAILRTSFRPPPTLSVSEWADRYRILPDTSARPGRWRTDEAPYLRGVMDACSDPSASRVVFRKPSQVGGTEMLNNVLGYFIHQDPSPILVVQYSVDEAHKWSKERLSAMIRDVPVLAERVATARSRDSDNTILSKSFPGGHLGVVGANAPAGLSARPRRIILLDEVDRYPPSAGTEGDPVNLALKRSRTFWNALAVMNSSPGLADASRITEAYSTTDQRRYMVPCPSCHHFQELEWENLQWDKRSGVEGPRKHIPETARYACSGCGDLIPESRKRWMVSRGVWRPTAEPQNPGWYGFTMSALPALWVRWSDLVTEWVEATSGGEPDEEKLRVFVNTSLGRPYEPRQLTTDADGLAARAEEYTSDPVPPGVVGITAGVDVQDDRLEVELVGWGVGAESWSLEYLILYGDPSVEDIWTELGGILQRTFTHPSGARLRVAAAGVDSGHHTQQVYKFCGARRAARVWAFKGSSQAARPIITPYSKRRRKTGALLRIIGTDTAKATFHQRLVRETPGPGYCHFPTGRDSRYYAGLLAERRVKTRNRRGYVEHRWEKRPGVSNEPLDCRVYAMGAWEGLLLAGLNPLELAEHLARSGKASSGRASRRSGRRVVSEAVQ